MFDKPKYPWIVILLITNGVSLLLFLIMFFYPNEASEETPVKKMIIVQIAGEVNQPNLYELESGSRLNDLILLADGFTSEADEDAVNLATILIDAMKITIPSIQDETESTSQLININTADLETLMTLKGIGEVKAQAIIDYRTENGYFLSIEEILYVSGIGGVIFAGIQNDITV